jgi:serine O-acetyltransferase
LEIWRSHIETRGIALSRIVVILHGAIQALYRAGIPWLPALLNKIFIRLLFGCQIGIGTKLGKKVTLGYGGLGTVIHDRAEIGDNVSIGNCVTIGGTSKKHQVPVIGENAIISTGAKILGPVTIGRNCVIGANAVVLDNVPDNCVAVGVPAKVIKTEIDITEYRTLD